MQAILSIMLAVLCINVGIYFVGNLMGIDTLTNAALDPTELQNDLEGEINTLNPDEGGINPIFSFGDFEKAIEIFEGIFAGGWIVDIIQGVCFNCPGLEYFTAPLQIVLLLLNVFGVLGFLRGINII
jgi:hypothetical protein